MKVFSKESLKIRSKRSRLNKKSKKIRRTNLGEQSQKKKIILSKIKIAKTKTKEERERSKIRLTLSTTS